MIVALTKKLVKHFNLGISGFFLFRYFTTLQNCLISEDVNLFIYNLFEHLSMLVTLFRYILYLS